MTTGQSMISTTQNTSLLSYCIHFLFFINKITPKFSDNNHLPV